ncbi:claudin-23 [Hemicordylus capensis]|uniref:claudin-23 n=1 Tax=Hemicordylus capensis TaxID=884348 RepID=UPI002304AD21|nr:claudin-23 [Hemicordylus capensis]
MRTPTAMIVGIVLCPCGLVLNLTSTLAPSWRDVSRIPSGPLDLIQHQGIWDICDEYQGTSQTQCGIKDSLDYFTQQPVQVAKGLMPSSVVVTVLGLVVASLGVRCWQDIPHYLLAGLGGLVLFISGLMSLIPISWYNHELNNLPVISGSTLQVGYCLVLGYLGSCLEIIGGLSLTLSFGHCCKERKRKKAAVDYSYPPSRQQGPATIAAISPSIDGREFELYDRTSTPKSYTNSLDVLEGESVSNRSRLPCDSDL